MAQGASRRRGDARLRPGAAQHAGPRPAGGAVQGHGRTPRPLRGQPHRRFVGGSAAAAARPHRTPPGALRGHGRRREAAGDRGPSRGEGRRRCGAERARFDRLAAQRAGRGRRQQPPAPLLRHRAWRARGGLVRGSPQAPARGSGASRQCRAGAGAGRAGRRAGGSSRSGQGRADRCGGDAGLDGGPPGRRRRESDPRQRSVRAAQGLQERGGARRHPRRPPAGRRGADALSSPGSRRLRPAR